MAKTLAKVRVHSEAISTVPIHSDICIQANANHPEPIQKTFYISFDKKQASERDSIVALRSVWVSRFALDLIFFT